MHTEPRYGSDANAKGKYSSVRPHRSGYLAGAAIVVASLAASLTAIGGASAATGVVVSTSHKSSIGTFLVSGKTLYALKPSKTPCTSKCLVVWPAFVLPKGATKATAGPGVNAAKLGTVRLSGGSLQVTYAGKPLYFFAEDTKPGQVNGNLTDQWGKWSTVVTLKSASTKSGSGSNSSGSSAGTGGVSF